MTRRIRPLPLLVGILALAGACTESREPPLSPAAAEPRAVPVPSPFQLFLRDLTGEEINFVEQFDPPPPEAAQIRAAAAQVLGLQHAFDVTDPANRARVESLLDEAEARLQSLVPLQARFVATGPDLGTGNVDAVLTSLGASGNFIWQIDITLEPSATSIFDDFVVSPDLVPVPDDNPILNDRKGLDDLGDVGGPLFVPSEAGGTIVIMDNDPFGGLGIAEVIVE